MKLEIDNRAQCAPMLYCFSADVVSLQNPAHCDSLALYEDLLVRNGRGWKRQGGDTTLPPAGGDRHIRCWASLMRLSSGQQQKWALLGYHLHYSWDTWHCLGTLRSLGQAGDVFKSPRFTGWCECLLTVVLWGGDYRSHFSLMSFGESDIQKHMSQYACRCPNTLLGKR